MHAKIGATVLTCLLYGQALFGLVAIAAVIMKEPQPRESAQTQTIIVATLDQAAMK